ncbi:MAG: DoxX family protein, partial [Armatimonadota bacterium]|nr:DoxX family protein [Armatimonadota bacterium]
MLADLGLLLLRVVVGVLFMGHGLQKLAGWFGGHGLAGTGQWLEGIGLRPGRAWALLAGALETVGGLLFALGLFTPLGTVFISAVML